MDVKSTRQPWWSGLLGLLLDGAGADLRLTLRELVLQLLRAELAVGAGGPCGCAVDALRKVGIGGGGTRTLLEELVAALHLGGREALTLSVDLLSDAEVALRCGGALTELLLSDASDVLRAARERGTVGLRSAETDTLLLLGGTECLTVVCGVELRCGLSVGEVLLTLEIGVRNTRSIAAERVAHDLLVAQIRAPHRLILSKVGEGRLHDALVVGRHVLADVQVTRVDLPGRARRQTDRGIVQWLRVAVGAVELPGGETVERHRRTRCAARRVDALLRVAGAGAVALPDLLCCRAVELARRAEALVQDVGGLLEVGCVDTGSASDRVDAALLGRVDRGDEFARVGLPRCGSGCLGASVDGIVARHHLRWDLYLRLLVCSAASA